jgi:hypothetical protein
MPTVVTDGMPNVCGGIAQGGVPSVRVGGQSVMIPNQPVTPHYPYSIKPICIGSTVTVAGQNQTVRAAGQPIVVNTDSDNCQHLRSTGNPTVRIGA